MLQAWFEDRDILATTLLASVALLALYSVGRRVFQPTKKIAPEGAMLVPYLSAGVPLLGNTLELARNADRFLDWMVEQCLPRDGHPFRLRLPGKGDMMLTARPEHYEQVVKMQFDIFPKGEQVHDQFVDLGGDAIGIINGPLWRYQRRVLVSLFSARALREHMGPIIQKHVLKLQSIFSRETATGKDLDVCKLMHRFTLDSFVEIGFGSDMGSLASKIEHPLEMALRDAQHIAAARRMVPTWLWKSKRWLNIGEEKHFRRCVQVLNSFATGIVSRAIDRRCAGPPKEKAGHFAEKDIVSIMLDNMEANNEAIDPVMVRTLALSALIAGRDTTADSLGWLVHLLTKHPEAEQKLRAALLESLPKLTTDPTYVPSIDEVQSIPYLEATICEALRLFPPVPYTSRLCLRDTTFPDGTFVPAGTTIGLACYAMARLNSVWGQDATSFVPERFIDPGTGKALQVSAGKFSTFSTGPRVCVGQRLAMLEMKILMACLVGRFHFAAAPDQQMDYSLGITLAMKDPLMVRVEPATKA